jgi:transposase
VAEREPRMAGHAEFVICEQSIERTIAWICHKRRMAKDYERLCATGEAFVYAAMTRLMVRRLVRA